MQEEFERVAAALAEVAFDEADALDALALAEPPSE
jgi:hypothetical protein